MKHPLKHAPTVGPGFGGGKSEAVSGGDSALDQKLNWNLRANSTVRGKDSKKPRTTPNLPGGDHDVSGKQPPTPMENYWGKQWADPAAMQYIRSFADRTPTVQRRFDGKAVSGVGNVQLINPVATTSRKRIVLYTAAGYLWAVVPRIPGQTRDNFAGFHMRGIDPQSYAALIAVGPGSQPSNPGGPGKIAGRQYIPPSVAGGINNTGYGSSS